MSSHVEENDKGTGKGAKRRRIGRACDMCRLKKIRCDGQRGPGQKCSNCAAYDDECTFVQDAPKRQSRPRGYVQRLEVRVAAMEELLARLCPASDLSRELDLALEENVRLGDSDFDDSDLSDDEADDENEEGVSAWISTDMGRERAKSKPSRDAFTYAIPPAFSPSAPAPHTYQSPATSGLSSPTLDSSPQPVTPYYSYMSPVYERPPDASQEEEALESSDDELKARLSLGRLSLDPNNVTAQRYFGKSSNVIILKKALEMKCAYARDAHSDDKGPLNHEDLVLRDKVRAFDARMKSSITSGVGISFDPSKQRMRPLPCMCPRDCAVHPWAKDALEPERPTVLTFPEPDLLYMLISLYFSYYNAYMPLLHRPLFLAALGDDLHFRDHDFGSVVLLVCALGARFSNDPRVLLDDDEDEGTSRVRWLDSSDDEEDRGNQQPQEDKEKKQRDDGWHSAGWKWFRQVRLGRHALVAPVSSSAIIDERQLASLYFRGSSAPEASRTITGLGLRLAQDLGAHRKKIYGNVLGEEQELLKRAFWVLVWLEWSISPTLGRPCGIQYEDFDVDLPIECDDEYWVTPDPAQAFKQPAGKPSLITYFNCQLRLNQINAFAMRTIYSTNKSKALLGFVGPQWEQRIVAELDSALNAWMNSVPEHLRWDPHNPHTVFFHQSASLYAAYYTLQISIHRPFIPSPRKPSRTSFPSLAICTNAARSCVHVLDAVYKRTGSMGVMHVNLTPLFTSGIVLMLNMWGSGSTVTKRTMKEMEDIYKVMDMLKAIEPRWHTAGRLWDMLYELAIVGELPLPPRDTPLVYQPPRRSHERKDLIHRPAVSPSGISHSTAIGRVSGKISPRGPVIQSVMKTSTGTRSTKGGPLPVRSDELGRLPLHPVFDADPLSSWNEYDMSPSMFNPPATVPTAPPSQQESGPPDPALDSIFTTSRSQRSTSLTRVHAPQPIFPATRPFISPMMSPTSDIPFQSQSTAPTDTTPSLPLRAQSGSLSDTSICNSDTLAMWSNAPAGFEWDDWGNYITNFTAPSVGTVNDNATFEQPIQDFTPANANSNGSRVFTFYDSPL